MDRKEREGGKGICMFNYSFCAFMYTLDSFPAWLLGRSIYLSV
jgi:hypothetical protein